MMLNLKQAHCVSKVTQLLDDQNHNLTRPQKELCLWHYRLAHAGFPWIQTLMRVEKVAVGEVGTPPIIPIKMSTTSRVDAPKCPSCLLAKQHRLNPGSQTTVNKPEREMAIRRKAEKPGDQVSADQFVSKVAGHLPRTFGKEPPTARYHGGVWARYGASVQTTATSAPSPTGCPCSKPPYSHSFVSHAVNQPDHPVNCHCGMQETGKRPL